MKSFIWQNKQTIMQLNKMSEKTLQQYMNIDFIEIGDDFLRAQMQVDWRTHQPHGVMHGGASVVLAETTGSMAAWMCGDTDVNWVGLEINANHISAVRQGIIYCTAQPEHIGKRTQIWGMTTIDSNSKLVCKSRLTMLAVKCKAVE